MKRKSELIEKIEKIEQELHNANNSIEYWSDSYYSAIKMYDELKEKVDNNIIDSFLLKCSIIQKSELENFIRESF